MTRERQADWRFYGRHEELDRLVLMMRSPGFTAKLIEGTRGVGKSRLVEEAVTLTENNPSTLTFEFVPGEQREERDERLLETAHRAVPAVTAAELDAAYADENQPMFKFTAILRPLLDKNVTIVLDEFHLAKDQKLEGPIKMLIDAARPSRSWRPPGKLFVMGSHQQKLKSLFKCDQPLSGRLAPGVKLNQWKAQTVLEMAEEQRFLDHPGRFLTLWTAFGGLPRLWEQFSNDKELFGHLSQMDGWHSDDEWRAAFLKSQAELLEQVPEERWDYRAYVELGQPQRAMILWTARERPEGGKHVYSDLVLKMRGKGYEEIDEPLDVLTDYLELMERYRPFKGPGPNRLRLANNNTLFQLRVFPEIAKKDNELEAEEKLQPDELPDERMTRLKEIEGKTLEKLAAQYFETLPDTTYCRCGAYQQDQEIDIAVVRGRPQDPARPVTLVSCKRNPENHRLDKTSRDFSAFIKAVNKKAEEISKQTLSESGLKKFVVSPLFTEEDRNRAARAGFTALDIPGMAAESGLAIKRLPPDWRGRIGQSFLHEAALISAAAVMRCLKENADPRERDERGMTPLHWAAEAGQDSAVRALLDAGADATARDKDGLTPLDLAKAVRAVPAIQLLTEAVTRLRFHLRVGGEIRKNSFRTSTEEVRAFAGALHLEPSDEAGIYQGGKQIEILRSAQPVSQEDDDDG